MAGNYWIKFYVEILDDPKMAMLSDHLWRRFYELCLIAGRVFEDGNIPCEKQIAWTLRVNESDIINDLSELEKLGLVLKIDGGWNIVNFKKRQNKMTPAEKMNRYRNEQKRDKYYEQTSYQDVTLSNSLVTQITDTDTDIDIENKDISGKPEPNLEPCDEDGVPDSWKEKPKGSKSHPAIIAFREVAHKYPNKILYDTVIDILGPSPDIPKMEKCYQEWIARGYNASSIKWLDWYAVTIPNRKGDNKFAVTMPNDEFYDLIKR